MKVLVACEESQAVTIAFREKGHEAYSCDKLPCSGGHPEWHIQADALIVAKGGWFVTQSGELVFIEKWDLMIGHPPCTYMSKAGARWMYPTAGMLCPIRYEKAMQARDFFMELLLAPIYQIALENPVPLKIIGLPKESQSIQPFEYGHPYSKRTLLWLKNLKPLSATNILTEYTPYLPSNTGGKKRGQKFMYKNITQQESSKTFSGIAKAMAEQWG